MATAFIENGKRVDDLIELHQLTGPSFFLVSDVNITRKISLETLRNEFNGDNADTNLSNVYYSVDKVNELINNVRSATNNLLTRLDLTDNRYSGFYNDIVAQIANIWRDIEDRYEFLFKWIDTLDAREARHYQNLSEWMYRLRCDIRERLRDFDYREMNHWVDHDNKILSLTYRMRDCEKRLDDYAVRIDDIEVWKHITDTYTFIQVPDKNGGENNKHSVGNDPDNNDNFTNILKAIDNKLIDLDTRVNNIEVWKNLSDISLTILKDIHEGDSLLQILTVIDTVLMGNQEHFEKIDAQLGGFTLMARSTPPTSLPPMTIYFQFFD